MARSRNSVPRGVYSPTDLGKVAWVSLLCRIGIHRWIFDTQVVAAPDGTHTEIIHARCQRDGCTRYSAWNPVHHESTAAGPTAGETPPSVLA